MHRKVSLAIIALATPVMAVLSTAPASAEPAPATAGDPVVQQGALTPEERASQMKLLEDAPAPQPIPIEDLPLKEEDKPSTTNRARGDASMLAADIYCGNWLSDPGAATFSSTRVPVSGTVYNGGGALGNGSVEYFRSQVNDGVHSANGLTFGWSKSYNDFQSGGTPPNDRVTTGWWDNAGDPHFCGWGSALGRTITSPSAAYTAGIRQNEATYIRAHSDWNGSWRYDTRKAY